MHRAIGVGLFSIGGIMLGSAEIDLLNSGSTLHGTLPYLWAGPVGNFFTAPFPKDGSFNVGTDFGIRIGAYLALAGLFLSLYPIAESMEYLFLIAIGAGLLLVLWSLET